MGLTSLATMKNYGLLGTPNTEWEGWNIQWVLCDLLQVHRISCMASFSVLTIWHLWWHIRDPRDLSNSDTQEQFFKKTVSKLHAWSYWMICNKLLRVKQWGHCSSKLPIGQNKKHVSSWQWWVSTQKHTEAGHAEVFTNMVKIIKATVVCC